MRYFFALVLLGCTVQVGEPQIPVYVAPPQVAVDITLFDLCDDEDAGSQEQFSDYGPAEY